MKQLAHAPRTQPDNWKKGDELTPAYVAALQVGTPIASGWNAAGFYPNESTGQHAGLFAGALRDASGVVIGFYIIEQHTSAESILKRPVYFDPAAHKKPTTYFHNGRAYATIQR